MSFVQPSESRRAQSALQLRSETFQARATRMLKNISGRFGGKTTKQDGVDDPYKHETRSMDVNISQPMLGLQIDTRPTDGHSSRTASSMSTSPAALFNSPQSTWDMLGQTPVRMAKSESAPAKARSNITSANLVTNDQVTVRVVQSAVGVPDIVVSGSPFPVEEIPNGCKTKTPATTAPATPAKISPITTRKPLDVPQAKSTPPSPPVLPTIKTASGPPQSSSPPSNVSSRGATPRITDMPPSAFVMNKEGGGVRLSPSIIMRPIPPPFLLPKMPAPSSRPPPPPPKPRSRLRSVPALSVDGTNELDQEADHDNSGLGDSDEDDEGDETNGGSDEDGEDLTHPSPTRSSRSDLGPTVAPTRPPDLPIINMTPFDLSFATSNSSVANTISRREGEMTPTASHAFDYFSAKPLPGPSGTPRVDNATPGPSTSNRPGELYPMTSPAVSRPAIHHQVSRSMVDLTFTKELPSVKDLDNQIGKGKGKAPAQPEATDPAPAYSEGIVRRRRSLPTYNTTSEPPPYPIFARRDNVVILPRDDEGRERLPDYSNSLHLIAIMPRKMEFSAPGVQAKDRKWRRTLCELQGTAFRVYKCPPGAAGVSVIGEWWEKKVGVGDIAISGASGSTVEDVAASEIVVERPSKTNSDNRFSSLSIPSGSRRTSDALHPQAQPATPTPKPKGLAASLLHPVTRGGSSPAQSRPHSRSQSEASGPGIRQSLSIARSTTRSSSQLNSSPASTSNHSFTATGSSTSSEAPSPSRSSFFPKSSGRNSVSSFNRPTLDLSNPDPADLIRVYTLQNAESGLGSDYTKRKNVIRVRMEGEQFLLQAQDTAEVVEWIEGFHAAANIALDLDERVMPKGPIFPRRRRRRRRVDPNRTIPSTPSDHPAQ